MSKEEKKLLDGWEVKRLGEVCKTGAGGTPLKTHKDYYENGTIPWLLSGEISQGDIFRANNFITEKGLNNSSAKIFPKDTVLVAMYGATAGQVGVLHFSAATNQAVCGILPNGYFIAKYLYYVFLSKKDELVAQAVGGAQPNISQEKIRNTIVPVVSLSEQKRIVAILDEAFQAIDRAKENAGKNLANAREVFESYLNQVFSNPGKDWEERKLGEICSVSYGHTEKAKKTGQYRFVRITDTDDEGLLTDNDKMFIDSFDGISDYLLSDGDLLMARVGASAGNVLFFSGKEKAVFASFLIRLLFRNNIKAKLYWLFTKTRKYWDQVDLLSVGSAQPQFNGGAVKQIMFAYPVLEKEQQQIIIKAEMLLFETKHLESIYQKKIAALDELKKSILQKAFSGEL